MIIRKNFILKNKKKFNKILETIVFDKHALVNNGVSTYNTFAEYHQYKVFNEIINKFISLAGKNYYVLEFWINIYEKGGFVKEHNHITTIPELINVPMKSGVYYFKKPNNSGNIIIDNKLIKVKEGDILLFNSDQNHYTEKNLSDEQRIVFSINLAKNIKKLWNNIDNTYKFINV
jgi:ASC-1-like (ASCH) protein